MEFSEWDILNDSKTETSECGENTSFFEIRFLKTDNENS
ncbi:hypothetical protein LEP1GSC123_2690 [Leptospira borgpetersenii str. 200701203]|uniref:Uncharacterized protein n=1 Tax=Leptospira borgpetersenii str. 200701203 TaxID=1193007 RepID=M3H4V3_LEPBO|nr:hypothetical protein LEP1GSC123_2690 [Leptospira borgpetersenii str. 200701203]